MVSSEVLSLVDQIVSAVQHCDRQVQSKEAEKTLLAISRKLTAGLETPFEVIQRISFQPYETAALRIAIQLDLLFIVKDGTDQTATELAAATGADRLLIIRVMRVLCATGIFEESGMEKYRAGRLASAFREKPSLKDNVSTLFDFGFNAAAKLPSYLQKTGFANPVQSPSLNGGNGFWQYALSTPLDFWAWLQQDPERVRAFNSSMTARRQAADEMVWFRTYPVIESLCSNISADQNEVLLVDIGGGLGQDIMAFHREFPSLPGRLVLQDQQSTLSEIDREHMESQGIEVLCHNFFDPQPIKGARAYYFHHIFHDWPDDECRAILKQTLAVMSLAGKSKLLIVENVLPNMGVSSHLAMRDMHMMTLFSSMERNESQWIDLLGQEGLEILRIWDLGPDSESLIEAVLIDPANCKRNAVNM